MQSINKYKKLSGYFRRVVVELAVNEGIKENILKDLIRDNIIH